MRDIKTIKEDVFNNEVNDLMKVIEVEIEISVIKGMNYAEIKDFFTWDTPIKENIIRILKEYGYGIWQQGESCLSIQFEKEEEEEDIECEFCDSLTKMFNNIAELQSKVELLESKILHYEDIAVNSEKMSAMIMAKLSEQFKRNGINISK